MSTDSLWNRGVLTIRKLNQENSRRTSHCKNDVIQTISESLDSYNFLGSGYAFSGEKDMDKLITDNITNRLKDNKFK